MKTKQLYILAFCLILGLAQNAQAQTETKVMEKVKALVAQKAYNEAYTELALFAKGKENDLETQSLLGQLAFEAKQYKQVESIYEANIAKHQEKLDLKLEYCSLLLKMEKLEKAELLLLSYLPYVDNNATIWQLLAQTQYWQGKYNEAATSINKAIELNAANAQTQTLRSEIMSAKASWISLGSVYNSDNQPLKSISTELKVGKYFNQIFNSAIAVQAPYYIAKKDDGLGYGLELSNQSYFAKSKLSISEKVGIFKFPLLNNTDYSWELEVSKKMLKRLKLSATANRSAYLNTLSSLYTPVMSHGLSLSAGWTEKNGFNAQIAAENRWFDNNSISSLGAWIVSPTLKLSKFELNAGYGFSFCDSEKDMFQAKDSTLIVSTGNGKGKNASAVSNTDFIPYYTPTNQQVHKVTAKIGYKASSNLNLSLGGSYGFWGEIDAPYLISYYDENSHLVNKIGYVNTKYNPYSIDFQASWNITKQVGLKASYAYNTINYYYSYQTAALSLRLNLWK